MKYLALIAACTLMACASSKKNTTPAATTPAPAAAPAAQQKAAVKQDKGGTLMSCTHGEEVRLLQVAPKDKGCVLNYTKSGKETAVASSRNGSEHCDKSRDKIKKSLESAGYTCK